MKRTPVLLIGVFGLLLISVLWSSTSQSSGRPKGVNAASTGAHVTPETAVSDLFKLHQQTWGEKRPDDLSQGPRADQDRPDESASEKVDDPDARAKWFMFQRQYPFNEIPAGARRQAWDSVPDLEKGVNLEAVGTIWSPIGPAPTTGYFPRDGSLSASGRINAIA